jgi:hypothetical protein
MNQAYRGSSIEFSQLDRAHMIAAIALTTLERQDILDWSRDETGEYHEFRSPNNRYVVVARPIMAGMIHPPPDTTIAFFPNRRLNFTRDASLRVTTRRQLQYSPNASDLTEHVVGLEFEIPTNDEQDCRWAGIDGHFEMPGSSTPHPKAEAVFYGEATPASILSFRIEGAAELSDLFGNWR